MSTNTPRLHGWAQEIKIEAIKQGAARALTALLPSRTPEVRRLSCQGLASLAQIRQGREALAAVGGVGVLCATLSSSPEAAAEALAVTASSSDGAALLRSQSATLLSALVAMINTPKSPEKTSRCELGAKAIAGICTTDDGIVAALVAQVPKCIVTLANRALSGDLKAVANNPTLLEACAACLMQLCHHPEGKTAVRLAEGISTLSELVRVKGHPAVVKKASSALMGITIEVESKLSSMKLCCNVLVMLLKGSDRDIALNARGALCNAAEDLNARRILEALLTSTEMATLLDPLPYPPPDYRYNVVLPYKPTPGLDMLSCADSP